MSDAELKQAIAELKEVVRCRCDEAYRDRGLKDPHCECDSAEAVKIVADRIKALTAERDQHWDSFVHWRKEADDRSEQLAAARQDAEEARAYAEELQQERNEAIRRRDAWKSKAEGYDAVRKALREKVGAPWPPNLSRALWAGIAADEKKRADDAEAKLTKVVEALPRWILAMGDWDQGGEQAIEEMTATLAEIKGESHE